MQNVVRSNNEKYGDKMRYGYACISMKLSYPQKYGGKEKGVEPITTGRTMIKRTFESKGVDYAS